MAALPNDSHEPPPPVVGAGAGAGADSDNEHPHISPKKKNKPSSPEDHSEPEKVGSVAAGAAGEGHYVKTIGRCRAALIYITNQVGIGVLSLPSALHTLGIIPGVICIVGMGLLATYAAYVFLQFYRRYPSIKNCVDCFEIIGGKTVGILVGIAFVLNLLLTCSAAIVTISIALNSISEHAACTVVFIGVAAIVSWLLCLPRKMEFIAHFGIPSTISILAAVLIVMVALGVSKPNGAAPDWNREIVLVGNPTFTQGLTSVLNIAFAFAGNQAFITVMGDMRDPERDFMPSIYILQLFAIPMYTIVGGVIYGLAGQYTTSPALGSAPMVPSKVAYGILLPTLLGTSLVFGHTSTKYLFAEALRIMGCLDQYDRKTRKTWILWVSIATVFWIVTFILANAIPLFDSILSITSALFISWFTFGIAGVMWLFLHWGEQFTTWRRSCVALFNWFIIAMVLFMTSAGMYASIEQMLAAYNDPNVAVGSSFTCADNSIWRQLGVEL